MNPRTFVAFDCESIGLHGETFAVGWAVYRDGVEVKSGYYACPPLEAWGSKADRDWVCTNVPSLPARFDGPRGVREAFWRLWLDARANGAFLLADCAWPVEANFLSDCVREDAGARAWEGPYPLVDLSAALLAKGMDPLQTFERRPDELPVHNPLADARQSARLWLEALP